MGKDAYLGMNALKEENGNVEKWNVQNYCGGMMEDLEEVKFEFGSYKFWKKNEFIFSILATKQETKPVDCLNHALSKTKISVYILWKTWNVFR